MYIDINCDLGEGFGNYTIGNDDIIVSYITSANIACGFHAGDYMVMRKTVKLCLGAGVSIGAHPGYPDLQGFGRRHISYTTDDIYTMILYQVGALRSIVEAEGGSLSHVKPHGALYNKAMNDREIAMAIVNAVSRTGDSLILLCPGGSQMEEAALTTGVKHIREAFPDRQYDNKGNLVARTVNDSVITIPEVCASRALSMVTEKRVKSIDGKYISMDPGSLCVHGDNPGSVEIARSIKHTLEERGIRVETFSIRRQ